MKKEKVLNICGVVVGIAMLILGFVTIGSNEIIGGLTASKAEFGADFYTYVYEATRAAANNTSALVAIIATLLKCFGWGIVFSGMLVIIHFCKCYFTQTEEIQTKSQIESCPPAEATEQKSDGQNAPQMDSNPIQ